MKKVLAAILCAALITSMSGCTNSSDEASEQINSNVISNEQGNEVNFNEKTDKNQLPSFDSFEKDMNRIIADVLEPIGRGDEVEEWSIEWIYKNDKSFNCQYGPGSSFSIMGDINDGKITRIFAFTSAIPAEDYDSESAEYNAVILMMPLGLFYNDYEFESFIQHMSEKGDFEENKSGVYGKFFEDSISYELNISPDLTSYFTIEFENDVKIEEHEEKSIVAEKAEETIIDTEYFTISIPSYWESDCVYEIKEGDCYNYTLSFYDRVSKENNYGGWLFSIELEPETEDYTIYPDYDVLGSLEVYRIGCYNIIVTYPTDVQCSEEDFRRYGLMEECIPGILKTISYKEECTFSSEPIPVYKNEEPEQKICGNFIGKWQDLGWGYSAPGGALRWDVEYRSDGTGTFYFVYAPDDIVKLDFNYTTFDTYLGESVDGILVEPEDGSNICNMTKYTWSNELQKMLMTMYEVNSNGTVNLDVYWVYANN